MEVYIFSIEGHDSGSYRLGGFRKKQHDLFYRDSEYTDKSKFILLGTIYENTCKKLIDIFWGEIVSNLKDDVCYVLVSKKDFNQMKEGLIECSLYNKNININAISGGRYSIEVDILIEENEGKPDDVYLYPIFDSFLISEKYEKSSISNLRNGPCLN